MVIENNNSNEARERKIKFTHYLWALIKEPYVFVAVLFLIILIFAAIFADLIVAYDPLRPNILSARLTPFSESKGMGGVANFHLLGTDALGRDMLTRLIYGARVSVSVGVLAVTIAGTIGTILGLIAGYYGRMTESIIMRTVDGFMAIPSLFIALFVLFVLGGGLLNMILILAFVRWVVFTRLVRGITISLKETSFIEAARAIGASDSRIIFKHILPHLISPLLVLATLEVALLILAEAGLSFLGLGLEPPQPSWGLMVARGREYIREAPWMIILPGLSIFLTTLSLNLVANWLRTITDPVQRWRWLI